MAGGNGAHTVDRGQSTKPFLSRRLKSPWGSGFPVGAHFFTSPLPPPCIPSDVFPAQMEGVKLVVNKVLSSHFQVLLLSARLPPSHLAPPPLPPFALQHCAVQLRQEVGCHGTTLYPLTCDSWVRWNTAGTVEIVKGLGAGRRCRGLGAGLRFLLPLLPLPPSGSSHRAHECPGIGRLSLTRSICWGLAT